MPGPEILDGVLLADELLEPGIEVVGVHVDDVFVRDGRVDTAAMRPIARMGYDEYAVVERAFRLRRPD